MPQSPVRFVGLADESGVPYGTGGSLPRDHSRHGDSVQERTALLSVPASPFHKIHGPWSSWRTTQTAAPSLRARVARTTWPCRWNPPYSTTHGLCVLLVPSLSPPHHPLSFT